MKQLFVNLKNAECDVEGALARFLDDEDLYEQFYKELLNDEAFTNLGKALEDGSLHDAFESLRVNTNEGVNEKYEELLKQREYFKQFIE